MKLARTRSRNPMDMRLAGGTAHRARGKQLTAYLESVPPDTFANVAAAGTLFGQRR